MPFLSLGAQALFIWPPIWLALVTMAFRDLRSRVPDERRRLLYCIGLGPIMVFTLVSPWAEGMFFHWAAPGYLMLMPMLGAELARRLEGGNLLWRRMAAVSAIGVALRNQQLAAVDLYLGLRLLDLKTQEQLDQSPRSGASWEGFLLQQVTQQLTGGRRRARAGTACPDG